jgi:diguanylate cyclase (GGDEF)-like protein
LEHKSERRRTPAREIDAAGHAAILKAAFDNMNQGFMVVDAEERVTDFNARAIEIVGYPEGVMSVGAAVFDLVRSSAALGHHPGQSVEQVYAAWRERLATGQPSNRIGYTSDGRTTKVGYAPVRDGAWVVSYEDISARVDAERALARQNERFSAALTNMPHGVAMFDADKRLILCNPGYSELYGLPPELTVAGTPLERILDYRASIGNAPRDMASYFDVANEVRATGIPGVAHVELADGRSVRIAHNSMKGGGYVVTHEDISARIEAERALAVQNERFSAALTNMPHGVAMFDADKRLILCNSGYSEFYELPLELTKAGTPLQRILDYRASIGNAPMNMASYFDVANEVSATGVPGVAHIELEDGRTVRIAHNSMESGGYVVTHEDITEVVSAEAHIQYMGSHDNLTGLPNRTLLEDRISEALLHLRPSGMFCVHYLNLDNFKSVNEVHGYSAGDLLLKEAVARLEACLSHIDTLARVGGDEFVVLQADIQKPEQAGILARRLLETMAEPFDPSGQRVYLGVSIGVSVCPGDGDDPGTILRHANMAMYRSKSEGRATYRFFEVAMDARLQWRRLLELDLRRAVANQEFELHYQPQVDAETQSITGCEALLRWRHPTRGMVPPSEFIPIAEEIGVIIPLGAWVIDRAIRDAATWPKHISLSINLSPAQFKGAALFESVVSALSASGLSPLRLDLEITESALLAESESTIATLNYLRGLGARIVMDDFGTGYSSLSYLRSFPFDKIKIDRSFIKDLGETGESSVIVKAVAALGAALGMKITAEGVETAEQFRMVRDHGCTEVQGYYFGRPCHAQALLELFREKEASSELL